MDNKLKENVNHTIFETEREPNKETRPQFDIIFRPFKKIEIAEKYVTTIDRGFAFKEG
jgi:hypothetical protein